jgi:large subunit ribosomal protein L35
MKSHSGASKRFKITGTGKFRYRKAWQNHRRHKTAQNLNLLGRMQVVAEAEVPKLRYAMPYR